MANRDIISADYLDDLPLPDTETNKAKLQKIAELDVEIALKSREQRLKEMDKEKIDATAFVIDVVPKIIKASTEAKSTYDELLDKYNGDRFMVKTDMSMRVIREAYGIFCKHFGKKPAEASD